MPYAMAYNRPAFTTELGEVAPAMGVDGGELDGSRLAELGLPADKRNWTAEQAIGIGRLIKLNPQPLDLASMRVLVGAAYDGDRQRRAGADRITEGV